MGQAHFSIDKPTPVEKVMSTAEDRFFNSYFSHTVSDNSIVKGNYVLLYRELKDKEVFPVDKLNRELRQKVKNVL